MSQTTGVRAADPGAAEQIVGGLVRRHSTAMVLLHHAVAEGLGLGAADHKCLDLLCERGAMTGSQLVAATGLTSGAVSGVVARLERAGYVHRGSDPHDGRKQILHPALDRVGELDDLFDPLRRDIAGLLESFDGHQLRAIAEFLAFTADRSLQHAVMVRAQARSGSATGVRTGVKAKGSS